jgi:S-(hydroxymethyl)glutathione dehydrogenase / alcohol dehydrogenase
MISNSYIYKNKAAVLEKINQPLKIKKLLTKKINNNQLLVRIKYTFVCGSQLNEIFGKKGKDKYLPHTLGHEGVGTVVSTGSKIKKFKKGQTVIISWIKNSKKESATPEHKDILNKKINSGPVSTFIKFAILSESRVYKISKKKLRKVYALYGCAMPTGVGIAMKTIKNLKKDAIISIYGMGGIGLIVFATLKYFGYQNIICIERNKERLKLLDKLGGKVNLNLSSFEKLIRDKKIKISNIKRSIDTSGNISLMNNAIKNLSNNGKAYIAGNPAKGKNIKINPYEIIYGKKIYGSIGGDISIEKNIKLFDKIVEKNPYLFNKFVNKSYDLKKINLAISNFLKGKIIRPLIKI